MIPNDYDLYLDSLKSVPPVATADAAARLPAPTPDRVQVASAIGFIESAQAEVAKAGRALVLAGDDPTGLDRITRDLDRELHWLRG